MYAGGTYNAVNKSYYLYNERNYLTMTPHQWSTTYACIFWVASTGAIGGQTVNTTSYVLGLRPVINLKDDVTFSSGEGSQNNPYVVSWN